MLTEQQIETMDYLLLGTMTNKEVADKVGISDRVIYKWKKNEEFKAELARRSVDFKAGVIDEANNILVAKLGQSLKNVIEIANDKGNSDKVRLDANFYIINRILGNTTTKIETNTLDDKENTNVDIDELLGEVKDNVINISQAK